MQLAHSVCFMVIEITIYIVVFFVLFVLALNCKPQTMLDVICHTQCDNQQRDYWIFLRIESKNRHLIAPNQQERRHVTGEHLQPRHVECGGNRPLEDKNTHMKYKVGKGKGVSRCTCLGIGNDMTISEADFECSTKNSRSRSWRLVFSSSDARSVCGMQ